MIIRGQKKGCSDSVASDNSGLDIGFGVNYSLSNAFVNRVNQLPPPLTQTVAE